MNAVKYNQRACRTRCCYSYECNGHESQRQLNAQPSVRPSGPLALAVPCQVGASAIRVSMAVLKMIILSPHQIPAPALVRAMVLR